MQQMIGNLKTILHGVEDEAYTELVLDETEYPNKLGVVVDKIESFGDSDRVVKAVRDGNVVFCKVGQFRTTNIDELKRTVAKIKTVVRAIDGEIVAVASNEWLIVAPPQARIAK